MTARAKLQRRALRGLLPTAIAAAVAGPALADDCQPVADAFDLLGKAPAYRQVTSLDGKVLLDSIAIGDDLYVRDGENWTKTSLKKASARR
ncbi:hypothetical protein [Rhizobium sp. G21]|uniref:hypothetical protein n=1 Tax=Rhizobium sp. G21 TaxID=2758439 RepID=UPI0015FF64AE|nr:hypothetical protein [Rhizobium sp. G21]MBB1248458.1 hypothetical protein [Rhizobium sp. G21]